MDTKARSEPADVLQAFLAALADNLRRAEHARERDAIRVTAEQDELLGAETLCGNDPTQAHGSVADNGNAIALSNSSGQRRVMAGAHHV